MSNFLPIGERLKEERLRLRFNQDDFSLEAGITRKTLFGYESGVRAPDAGSLSIWAKMGLDVTYVVTGQRIQSAVELLEPEEKVLLNAYRELPDKGKKDILLSILAFDDAKKKKTKNKNDKASTKVSIKGDHNIGNIAAGNIKVRN